MIVRQFQLAVQNAPAGRRAETAANLARAYLHGNLGPDAAWEAKTALLSLLDDPAIVVRRALAEACAAAAKAPRPLIVALASDVPEVACLVLARSPILMDADLVDCAAIGGESARAAIAGRSDVSKPVAAALAEVAGPDALAVLAGNRYAAIGTAACLRMLERHGDHGVLREALAAREDLAVEVRQAVAARAARELTAYTQACGWISPERGERIAREAAETATLALSDEIGEAGLARLVAHLRAVGELNSGLILRAILSMRMAFAEAALSDLSGLSRARVAGLLFEPKGAGFAALHRKAGLPALLLPPIQAALSAWNEAATGRTEATGPALARRMIERALTACEDLPLAETRGLMALLARFEAEAAREEARQIADTVAGDAAQEEIRRIEQEERALLEAPASPAAPVAEDRAGSDPADEPRAFPLEAVLDELPDQIVASYREEQQRKAEAAANAVLDGLPDALMASFLATRQTKSVPVAAPEPVVAEQDAPKVAARPREVAVAAGMMFEEVVASYRGDRERVRLAA